MRRFSSLILVLGGFLLASAAAFASEEYVLLIPNGESFSCSTCHTNVPTRNQFGKDFAGNSHRWNFTLANKDSDADGYKNGVELQDPSGTWTEGSADPGNASLVSNPGNINSVPPGIATATPTATQTQAPTPSLTPPPTLTPSPTPSPTPTQTATPSSTPSPTASPTESPTESPAATAPPPTSTPAPTATLTSTPSPTATPTPSATSSPTAPPTLTPIPTTTFAPTPSLSPTPSPTPTLTPDPGTQVDSDGDGYADGYETDVALTDPSDAQSRPTLGDVDGDGKVTLVDSLLLSRLLSGRIQSDTLLRPDLDLDGECTSNDALILYRWLVQSPGYEIIPMP